MTDQVTGVEPSQTPKRSAALMLEAMGLRAVPLYEVLKRPNA